MKNFGFADEVTVVAPGINGKMNEIQAAYGILQLKYIDENIRKNTEIACVYSKNLENIKGIHFLLERESISLNNSYFPVFLNKKELGISRDEVYEALKQHNIYGRRYFYPLISQFPTYKELPSSGAANLPVAHKMAEEVLCLPIYPDLPVEKVNEICDIIIKIAKK